MTHINMNHPEFLSKPRSEKRRESPEKQEGQAKSNCSDLTYSDNRTSRHFILHVAFRAFTNLVAVQGVPYQKRQSSW